MINNTTSSLWILSILSTCCYTCRIQIYFAYKHPISYSPFKLFTGFVSAALMAW